MSDPAQDLAGPDFTLGVARASISDGGVLLGHAHGSAVLLARRGNGIYAIGATCTHYGGPLAEGLVVGDTIRCPWHHACFSLRTGEALRAPALDAVRCWQVEQRDDTMYVTEPIVRNPPPPAATDPGAPNAIVIVGGGAAGNAAAEMLRREGFTGRLTMLSADAAVPCDRPNLSKGFLAGTAPLQHALLRTPEFYAEQRIDLIRGARVAAIDATEHQVTLEDGTRHLYDALLLATGANPIRLAVPGSELPHVHYLRTLADSQRLVAAALVARHAVVIGASFIGLEVAASLRARGVAVQVIAPEGVPMERALGTDVGAFIRQLHEQHGVVFHLGMTVTAIDEQHVTLKSGAMVAADLVVVGIGVRPDVALAESAGLAVARGVVVDEYLETSSPGVFAAGDIARWPDPISGEPVRIEHWAVAERQGQTAARNMLGRRERFAAVPFFWTEQYDFVLSYVGHAAHWDAARLDGRLDAEHRDCTVTYSLAGRTLAVATVFRDMASLQAEVALETLAAKPLR
jgi:NADPH-dependent 2,4-dienoyl-CoA reductase/sulfur reductase-like enzyme/nitrite reductase/ring-hydroxylating ferredoxin subunit